MASNDAQRIILAASQIRAARALLRWTSADLAAQSLVGIATIKRAEGEDGDVRMTSANTEAVRRAFESAGVEFIPENGGGPGVRLRGGGKRQEPGHELGSVGPEDETRGGPQAPEEPEIQVDD